MNVWRLIGIGCLLGSLVGCQNEAPSLNLPDSSAQSPSPSTGTDRVASCDEAPDGTPCGEPGEDKHCIFDACVQNACGDGYISGAEECDDGDETDGDGCSARCRKEVCGNGAKDFGEACDDGNEIDGDGCNTRCELDFGLDGGLTDSGAATDAAGPSCPIPDADGGTPTIVATPPAAPIGSRMSLRVVEEVSGASYLWSSGAIPGSLPPPGSGSIVSKNFARTQLACSRPGDLRLSLYVGKSGCVPVVYTLDVSCLPLDADAGANDAGSAGDAGLQQDGGGDAGSVDTDAGLDGGIGDAGLVGTDAGLDGGIGGSIDAGRDAGTGEPDTGAAYDAGQSGTSLSPACQSCVEAACSDYNTINLVGPCFQESPDALLGSVTQPEFTQLCYDTVSCSLNSIANCADDELAGPASCYCGDQPLNDCVANGPLASAECVDEWEAATQCPSGDYACVAGANFSDLSRPSGYAFFLIECANNECATECDL